MENFGLLSDIRYKCWDCLFTPCHVFIFLKPECGLCPKYDLYVWGGEGRGDVRSNSGRLEKRHHNCVCAINVLSFVFDRAFFIIIKYHLQKLIVLSDTALKPSTINSIFLTVVFSHSPRKISKRLNVVQ